MDQGFTYDHHHISATLQRTAQNRAQSSDQPANAVSNGGGMKGLGGSYSRHALGPVIWGLDAPKPTVFDSSLVQGHFHYGSKALKPHQELSMDVKVDRPTTGLPRPLTSPTISDVQFRTPAQSEELYASHAQRRTFNFFHPIQKQRQQSEPQPHTAPEQNPQKINIQDQRQPNPHEQLLQQQQQQQQSEVWNLDKDLDGTTPDLVFDPLLKPSVYSETFHAPSEPHSLSASWNTKSLRNFRQRCASDSVVAANRRFKMGFVCDYTLSKAEMLRRLNSITPTPLASPIRPSTFHQVGNVLIPELRRSQTPHLDSRLTKWI